MSDLYPLLLQPRSVTTLWGGEALAGRFGKQPAAGQTTIAESWECWDDNSVANGTYAGQTIAQLRTTLGAALEGPLDSKTHFPLLTKLIDARQSLSVQVHPDDAYAMRVESQPNGKTECWYILEAEPGATLVLGWNRDTTRDEYQRRVADGTLGDLLRHVPVHPGDVFYLPAGTLHAIGAGIVLFELQQDSDLTYRIFDWNRLGTDGKPRELNVAKAADVLDYERGERNAIEPLQYETAGAVHTAMIAGPQFSMERITLDGSSALELDGLPLVVMPLANPIDLASADGPVHLQPYQTAIVPAGLGSVVVSAQTTTAMLAAAPPGGHMLDRLRASGITQSQISGFLAQF